jgi:ring-1,2-phenylacetyl-CoA epoxidase subunit PaaE
VNGEELRRSYSICSSPLDVDHFRIAVKKVPNGRASTQLVEKLKRRYACGGDDPDGQLHHRP